MTAGKSDKPENKERRRGRVFYPIVAQNNYRELTPERIRFIRHMGGRTQAEFAKELTDIVRRWVGKGMTPIPAQQVQHYEVGRYKVNALIGPAILVLEEEYGKDVTTDDTPASTAGDPPGAGDQA